MYLYLYFNNKGKKNNLKQLQYEFIILFFGFFFFAHDERTLPKKSVAILYAIDTLFRDAQTHLTYNQSTIKLLMDFLFNSSWVTSLRDLVNYFLYCMVHKQGHLNICLFLTLKHFLNHSYLK